MDGFDGAGHGKGAKLGIGTSTVQRVVAEAVA
jgi:hypothetical protein